MTQDNGSNTRSEPVRLPPPTMVNTPEQVDALARKLRGVRRLAVDTESNSLYAYEPQVCLIQLSTDEQDWLVDPLMLDDPARHLTFLGDIFADDAVEKVLHAAEYDVMTLNRDYGFEFASLFDTMIAARVLGWEQIGLGSILKQEFGVEVNKRHQRADWGRRPIKPDMIRYARMDTHYLLTLRDKLYDMLAEGDHVEEAREMFEEVAQARWSGNGFEEDGFWRITGARELSPRAAAVLQSVYLFRETQAARQDVPVFKVMGDKALVALARAKPRSLDALEKVKGISGYHVRRYGNDLLDAIRRGLKAEPPSPPARSTPPVDEQTLRRYDALHTWRKKRAIKRGVSSEVIVSKDALWEMAHSVPRSLDELSALEHIGPWRVKTYGSEILNVLANAG